jgi:hypothetical protein
VSLAVDKSYREMGLARGGKIYAIYAFKKSRVFQAITALCTTNRHNHALFQGFSAKTALK